MQQPKTLLLSTAYFGPIQYYSKLLQGAFVVVERHEHYSKQSYRNRCTVSSANGLMDLVVPIAKTGKAKIPITEAEIAYDTLWQKIHFKTIESAYRRSPFYEYYIDDLLVFFNKRHPFLYEFNMQILNTIQKLIKIPAVIQESRSYHAAGDSMIDLRNAIHPKQHRQDTDPDFAASGYVQVFSDKFGFQPNLSILDLLFNTGPEARAVLEKSCRR
jgi:hypothetical protein